MELKLCLYINECGISEWYVYDSFESFYNGTIERVFQACYEEDFNTKEKVKHYIDNNPYIEMYAIDSNSILDEYIEYGSDETIEKPIKEILKGRHNGEYLGEQLFKVPYIISEVK